MPPRRRGRPRTRGLSSVPAVLGDSSSEFIDAASAAEGEQEEVFLGNDIGSDSESEDDFQVVDDVAPPQRSVADVIADASATRISAVTRQLYDSHMRQMAVWCSQNDRLRCHVVQTGTC